MHLRQFITALFLLAMASCDDSVPAAQPVPPPLKLIWDVSQDNRIERVAWPAAAKDHIWLIDGPGTVQLKIRGGVEHEVKFHNAQVWREGRRIKTICLKLDIGTIDTVYADAMKLAKDWRITKTKDIQVFKDTQALKIKRGGDGVYYAGGGDELIQGRSIEIRESFDSASGKPYYAILAMGFYPDYDTAATQPASRPVEREK